MKVKLIRYSKTEAHGRKSDKAGKVEWDISITKDGYISIKTETEQVYMKKIKDNGIKLQLESIFAWL